MKFLENHTNSTSLPCILSFVFHSWQFTTPTAIEHQIGGGSSVGRRRTPQANAFRDSTAQRFERTSVQTARPTTTTRRRCLRQRRRRRLRKGLFLFLNIIFLCVLKDNKSSYSFHIYFFAKVKTPIYYSNLNLF